MINSASTYALEENHVSGKTDCPQRHQNILCADANTQLVRRNAPPAVMRVASPRTRRGTLRVIYHFDMRYAALPHPLPPTNPLFWPPQGIRLLLSYPLPLIDSCIPLRACSFSPYICIQQERVSHVMRQIMKQVISEQWHVSVRFITCWQWSSPSTGLKILCT